MEWLKFCIAGLLLWAFWVRAGSDVQAQDNHQEIEVTVDWIRAIEPELAKQLRELGAW